MKTSFIATVLNEEKTIGLLLKSLKKQTIMPDEIIIVDGGSRDGTVDSIKYLVLSIRKKTKIKLIIKRGNRAVGRNEGIRQARGDVILVSDAGCILKEDWIEKIIEPFILKQNSPQPRSNRGQPSLNKRGRTRKKIHVDVVAGYYQGRAETVFQKCLIPYVLVMDDKVNPKNFLPATRSMAFTKSIWKKAGGFSEKLSHNEDYAFAHKLKSIGAKIVFQKEAIVYWFPRKNVKEAYIMFYRFAYGDAQSHIFRPKVLFIFIRYICIILLIITAIIFRSYSILYTLYFILFLYLLWSIVKNYRYVKDVRAIMYLPLLQLVSDIAVLCGSVGGIFT
jgi:glycosyltransferase involved in cell wall biosynthesis